MARLKREAPNFGTSAYLQSLDLEKPAGTLTATVQVSLYKAVQMLLSRVFGGLSFGTGEHAQQTGNIDGQWVTILTPAVANTSFGVPHGLSRVPVGWVVVNTDLAVNLYRDTALSWTDTMVYLKADAASATVVLFFI